MESESRTNLILCGGCQRHLHASESSCPFCSAPLRRVGGLAGLAMAVITPMVLAACYGSADKDFDSGDTATPADLDGDGFDSSVDCDDSNEDINPGAEEICDDELDNDCDEAADADDSDCAESE